MRDFVCKETLMEKHALQMITFYPGGSGPAKPSAVDRRQGLVGVTSTDACSQLGEKTVSPSPCMKKYSPEMHAMPGKAWKDYVHAKNRSACIKNSVLCAIRKMEVHA